MAKRRRSDRLDGIDAEHVRRTCESPGWQLIRQRIERARSLKVEELLQPLDPVKTAQVRGMIEAYKLALDIPQILQKEAKDNRKDGDTSGIQESGSEDR
jgi:hypothetical protein